MFRIQRSKPIAIGWWLLAAALLFALFWTIRSVAAADSSSRPIQNHLVTIHDRGEERTIVTDAKTVRQALKEADVTVSSSDITEPRLDAEMGGEQYNVNIYRARPVVIEDGAARTRVMTAAQSPTGIVAAAGKKLYDEDRTTMQRVDDVVADGGPGLKLSIDRATVFTLVLYGKPIEARTQATTVGDMLAAKGIKLGKDDGVSPAQSTPITAGMKISVWRNGVQTVTLEEDVAMPVRQIQAVDKAMGYREVQTAGKTGKKQVTYQINMQNGAEISRVKIQEVVTVPPAEQVELIGTKAVLPAGSHEDWMAAAGIAASDYGYVNYIVMREGGWEPCKVQGGAINCNYSGSMGYGIVQATPGGKMVSAGADWRTNPITQLKWATRYAVARYGSWQGAYNHWLSSHNW